MISTVTLPALTLVACAPRPPNLLDVGPDVVGIVGESTGLVLRDYFRPSLDETATGSWTTPQNSGSDDFVSAQWTQDQTLFAIDALFVGVDEYNGNFTLTGPWTLSDGGAAVIVFDLGVYVYWHTPAGTKCASSIQTGTATYSIHSGQTIEGFIFADANTECDGVVAWCAWEGVDVTDRSALEGACQQ